ncbi:hypothetical protein ABL78_4750 [Leptomonas seymouri]|uniref:Transmembrane protein n=1 Tax=Leptomonas seymouri TaxID=5684 RepID=A0A0N0P5N6_LEPSE|nr:hypothetical protein ABL78_4750 [Leptomonas seymouri]|eukprot:KPI86197.1 hypothetical protein ABL78_4750 [Leptomonas seymouri]
MLLFRCDEATVYATVTAISATLFLFTGLRAAVRILGSLIKRVTQRLMKSIVERVLCIIAFFISIVVFAGDNALLPALMLLASVTSAALCRSLLSYRWLWVASFVFYNFALLNIVGPLLVEDVDVAEQEWATLMRNQYVLVPSSSAIAAASPGGSPSSRYLYSYYDSTTFVGSASPLLASVRAAPKLTVATVSGPQAAWVAGGSRSRAGLKPALNQIRQEEEGMQPTRHIIASGDNTLLTHYAELRGGWKAQVPLVDSIYLLGQRSSIEHSHIHCLISAQDSSVLSSAFPPCLHLHYTTLLRNVTIHWAELADVAAVRADETQIAWHVFRAGQDAPQTCTEVQSALTGLMSRKGGLEGWASTTTSAAVAPLLGCMDGLSVSELPPSFVAKAPLSVRFWWRFPDYFYRAQVVFFFMSERIIPPFSLFLARALNVCGCVIVDLFRWLGRWLIDIMPHLQRAAEKVAIYAGGFVCDGSATTSITPSSFSPFAADIAGEAQGAVLHAYAPSGTGCVSFRHAHASNAAFRAGVQTRKSVLAALSALADVPVLLPGVWSVIKWAWDLELAITTWALVELRVVAHFLVFVVPRPLMHVLRVVVQYLGVVLPHLCTLLHILWQWLGKVSLLPYLSRLFKGLWALEVRWMSYEWSLFKRLVGLLVCLREVVWGVLTRLVGAVFRKGGDLVARYGQTSFSIHLVVLFLQSLLLLMAMRNEMRDLIDAARQRSTGSHSPLRFFERFLPQSVSAHLPLQSITARVNGFLLLIRAHHQACVHYLLLHSVGTLVLIGLSVLPFAGKLYGLSLRYVLPWMSSKAFVNFFDDPPSARATTTLFVVRMVLSTTLQQTIGDFLYHVVKDTMIAVGLTVGLALALWAWPQRTELAKQVATAIADSLHGTPMPTPQRSAPDAARALLSSPLRELGKNGARQCDQDTSLEGSKGDVNDDDLMREDAVTKQLDLSWAAWRE